MNPTGVIVGCMVVMALIIFAISGCTLKHKGIAEIAINEAGYQTAKYLLKDASDDFLTLSLDTCVQLSTGVTVDNVEHRITETLKGILNILANKENIDAEARRYIDRGLRFLNSIVDIKEDAKERVVADYIAYTRGCIDGITILKSSITI